MPIRAMVFDLFDTLVDLRMEDLPEFAVGPRKMRGTLLGLHRVASAYCDLDLAAFVAALSASDRALRQTAYAAGRELPTIERFGAFARGLGLDTEELPRRLTETHMQGIRDVAHFLPHHPDVLARLHRDHRLGVCSNFSHTPTALAILDQADLSPHLDAVVISEQVGMRKPRPEIFHAVLERLGVPPEETLHVGDRLDADVRGPAAVGQPTAWLTRRVADPDAALREYDGPPPTHVIADLAEIEGL